MQVMYIQLCCWVIWDVGGVWHWLVVAQRKTVKAVARFDAHGQVMQVFTITRQGFHHSHLQLIAGNASQMNLQAPVNANGDLAHSQRVLQLVRAVMAKGFNEKDTLCKSCGGTCVCLSVRHPCD